MGKTQLLFSSPFGMRLLLAVYTHQSRLPSPSVMFGKTLIRINKNKASFILVAHVTDTGNAYSRFCVFVCVLYNNTVSKWLVVASPLFLGFVSIVKLREFQILSNCSMCFFSFLGFLVPIFPCSLAKATNVLKKSVLNQLLAYLLSYFFLTKYVKRHAGKKSIKY